MLDRIFLQILNMGLSGSFVILALMAVRLLLKKAPKRFAYALWGVALFRLLCPFSLESAWSLLPLNPQSFSGELLYAPSPQINTGLAAVDRAVNASLPAAALGDSVNPLQIWIYLGALVWLIGFLAILLYSGLALLRLRRSLRASVCLFDPIYLSEQIDAAFVLGVFRLRIYLPATLPETERAAIVCHEQLHIRRFDPQIRLLAFLALALHWFNPLVWLAFNLAGRDMEMSCDEAVLREIGSGRRADYSQTLLNAVSGRKSIAGTPLAFGGGQVKERLQNIMNYKKPSFWLMIAAFVSVIAIGLTLSTNPAGSGNKALENPATVGRPTAEAENASAAALREEAAQKAAEEKAALQKEAEEKAALQKESSTSFQNRFQEDPFYILTVDNGPYGCQMIVRDSNALDLEQVLEELEHSQGYMFALSTAQTKYVYLGFRTAPKSFALRYSTAEDALNLIEYPTEGDAGRLPPLDENSKMARYLIKVPPAIGIYNFFADVHMADDSELTISFRITVKEQIR